MQVSLKCMQLKNMLFDCISKHYRTTMQWHFINIVRLLLTNKTSNDITLRHSKKATRSPQVTNIDFEGSTNASIFVTKNVTNSPPSPSSTFPCFATLSLNFGSILQLIYKSSRDRLTLTTTNSTS